MMIQVADTKTVVPHIINLPALESCRKGLTKRMRAEKQADKRNRLKEIRNEIDFLIDNL